MKKHLFILALMISSIAVFSQTAIDFTLNDCNGTSQNLFSTLNKGKIVILIYEHQCSSCTQGTTNVTSVLNANYSGDTNIIVIYLDNGGNTCTQTSTWISSHSFVPGPYFEYSNDGSSPYGSGMPIIVVAAGSDHLTYLEALGVSFADTATVHNAIKAAYNHILGIETTEVTGATFDIYPNPADEMITINTSISITDAFISIYNLQGQQIWQQELLQNITEINLSPFAPGLYLLKYKGADGFEIMKFLKK